LAIISGLAVLFVLLDLTDFFLVRTGHRSLPGWRPIINRRTTYAHGHGDPRRKQG
jgi:hypothetical protein